VPPSQLSDSLTFHQSFDPLILVFSKISVPTMCWTPRAVSLFGRPQFVPSHPTSRTRSHSPAGRMRD
jgi:hypothetical protein